MAKVKFVLNRAGVSELMKSSEMISVMNRYANNALGRLGDGFGSSVYVGKTRANVEVAAETVEAMNRNKKNNSILKAVFGK